MRGSHRARVATSAAVVVAMLLGTVALPAQAHEKSYKSSVVLDTIEVLGPGSGKYTGHVQTRRSACKKARKVSIHHSIPGQDFKIGDAVTDDDGNWTILGPIPPEGGVVYTKMKVKVLFKSDAHKHSCRKHRSKDYPVDDFLD